MLLNEAEAFENARRIRAYASAMRDTKTREWVEWALGVADRLDPAKGQAYAHGRVPLHTDESRGSAT